jgi:hypothetical protein
VLAVMTTSMPQTGRKGDGAKFLARVAIFHVLQFLLVYTGNRDSGGTGWDQYLNPYARGPGMEAVIRKSILCHLLTIILLQVLIAVPAFGLYSEPNSQKDAKTGLQGEQIAARNPAYNDCALFIAGLSNRQGTLAASENKPTWIKYARFISQSWERFDQRHLTPMREWASKEISSANTATVFYPFSGPDFVNMYTLFPHAKTYLMIALEPAGEIPDFSATAENHFFANLERSLYDLLQLNFFITDKLKNSLGQPKLKGILPVLLFFLAREKTQVLDVRYWVMKPDGTIEESPAVGMRVLGRDDVAGVRLDFSRVGSEDKQTLYYFRFNLRDDSLQRHEKFVSFLKGFGPLTTFAKAASYLMHKPRYSGIRQFILDQSLFVLEGDSAIPVKYFDRTAWNLRFFGTYTSPIQYFKNFRQKDLAEIYKAGTDVLPLPFGIDYCHRLNTSNLMFASKKVELASGVSK